MIQTWPEMFHKARCYGTSHPNSMYPKIRETRSTIVGVPSTEHPGKNKYYVTDVPLTKKPGKYKYSVYGTL
jgi:hypothetical protein